MLSSKISQVQLNSQFELVVIGGGPAGFMAAITAAEHGTKSVLVLEAGKRNLEKVRFSGGGRCNVTHASWEPSELVQNYPRGQLPLLSAFSHFATGDSFGWFEDRGLNLKIESDGRIFPKSNSSLDVIRCLELAAEKSGVICLKKMFVQEINFRNDKTFSIKCKDDSLFLAKKVLIATGGNPIGKKFALSLGHKYIATNPSLFSFKISSKWLKSCQGIAIDDVVLKLIVGNKKFTENGRILITHNGLTGPAILRISAFAARELYNFNYKK